MNNKCLPFICILWIGIIISPPVYSQESAEIIDSVTPTRILESLKLSGSLHSTYWFRDYGSRDDHDLYEFFSLNMEDIVKDRIDGAFSMSWHEDLNGASSLNTTDSYDPFVDLNSSADIRFRYYLGYLDFKQIGFDESRLRVGRQFLEMVDYAHFDGASYQFSPIDPLEITVFGGRPITYYSSTHGDALYGTNFEYRFSPHTKAALLFYRYDTDQFRDDLIEAQLWHRFTPNLQTHLELSLLDGEPYLLQSDWHGRVDVWDVDASIQIIHLFDNIGDHTINFNPYFPLLNGYEPFTYFSSFLSKGLNSWMSLHVGLDFRETESTSDPVSAYTNRDFVRFIAGAEFYPLDKLTLSIDGEFWDVDSGDEFTGITGEIEYSPSKKWDLSFGVDYGEYVQEFRDEFILYNTGQDNIFRITPDVLTYFTRVKWKPNRKLYTAATFQIEDSDYDDDQWYSLRLELGVHF